MTWLGSLFGGIASMFASWMASKTIFTTAVVSGFVALTAAFIATLNALLSNLFGVLPSWAVGLGYLLPNNAAVCFSIWTSAKIARWIYDFHMDALRTAAKV